MGLIPFQKPDRVVMQRASDFHGIFEFCPLEKGYGVTIGNAMRRVLLASLEGFAITHVKINSVDQEFSTIKGVVEDVVNIILNLNKEELAFANEFANRLLMKMRKIFLFQSVVRISLLLLILEKHPIVFRW